MKGSNVKVAVALLISIVVALATPPAARAESKQALDDRLRAQLAQTHPEALAAWDEANAATARGDADQAVRAFTIVTERAPSFDAAFRRVTGPLLQLGRSAEARAAAEAAVKIAGTPLNRASLAELLMGSSDLTTQQQGLEMAREASAAAPDDAYIAAIVCDGYLQTRDAANLRTCTARLIAQDPDDPHLNILAAITAANFGQPDDALRHLEVGRSAISPADYERMRGEFEGMRTRRGGAPGWIWIGLWVLAAWAAGLLFLFVAGGLLSFVTLRSVERTATAASGTDGGGQRGLRRAYALVIAVASVYFYISIPVVVLSVLGLGVGIIWGVVAAGYIAPRLFIAVVIIVGVTVAAVLRSLFVKPLVDAPGVRLDVAQHPALGAALAEVAEVVGTRPVDAVYLLPGCEIAVSERTGWRRAPERRLLLGVGVLDGMQQGWLKSILAHEHGHFRNEDTAGGGVALAVRRSLVIMTVRLAQSGAAAWFNPAWLFVRMYLGAFLRVSQGASRLQEVMADRWAALAYGSAAFDAGFRHVIARDAAFDRHATQVLADVIDDKRPLANFYQHQPQKPAPAGPDLDDAIAKAMDRPAGPFDSHPAPRQRLAWVAALAAPPRATSDDEAPAWALFSDRDAIERLMTDEVCANVAKRHGVTITRAG
jgi:Zn-dependent protease with chaperone function